MMGLPLVTLIQGRTSKGVKGKTPQIRVKQLEKIKAKAGRKLSSKRQFWLGTKALQEIRKFQKSMDLLIPKAPFL